MENERIIIFKKIREMSCFRKLTDAELQLFLRYGVNATYRRQKALSYQSEPAQNVFFLISGKVTRLKYRSDESCVVLGHAEAGDWIGLAETLIVCPYLNDAIVEIKTEAIAFSARAFNEVMKIKGIGNAVLEYLAKSVYSLHSQIELNMPLPKLIRYITTHARIGDDGSCTLAATQDELAQAIGVTRETVNRYLQILQAESLLTIGRGHIDIPDIDVLRDRAEI
jgi:CRP-like cAMP-binding protein